MAKYVWRDQDLRDLLPSLPTESSTTGLESDPFPSSPFGLISCKICKGCVLSLASVRRGWDRGVCCRAWAGRQGVGRKP